MEEENILVESRESSMPQILNSDLCSRHHEEDCDDKLSSEDIVLKSNLGYMVDDSYCNQELSDSSASPVANTPVEVVNLENVRCSQLDTQTPASIMVTHEQKEEDTTLVFEVSAVTPNLCDVRSISVSVEVRSVLSKSERTPANYNEKPAASLESPASKLMDVCNSGQSHASSPFSLYGLKEGISLEELVDSQNAVRSSKEISLGMPGSQSKIELSKPEGILKEPLVDIPGSPSCYQLRQLFSVTSDEQICEVVSSQLEANSALSRSGKDHKVSSVESPISLSTFWETNADDAELSLGMSSSRMKCEASNARDILKEAPVDVHDRESDKQLCEVASSQLEVNNALSLVDKDHQYSSGESPFSRSIFRERNADDAEVAGSQIHMKTMPIAQEFEFELQRDRDLVHSDDTEFIEHSHGNVSTDCEDETMGDKDYRARKGRKGARKGRGKAAQEGPP